MSGFLPQKFLDKVHWGLASGIYECLPCDFAMYPSWKIVFLIIGNNVVMLYFVMTLYRAVISYAVLRQSMGYSYLIVICCLGLHMPV